MLTNTTYIIIVAHKFIKIDVQLQYIHTCFGISYRHLSQSFNTGLIVDGPIFVEYPAVTMVSVGT